MKVLPDTLKQFKLELNTTCFNISNDVVSLSSTPDGKCIIEGAVCPVELLTTIGAKVKGKLAIQAQIRERSRSQKAVYKRDKKLTSLAKLKAANLKEKRRESKDVDYRPNKGKERQGIKRHISLSNLSDKTPDQKTEDVKENRSIAQASRRHRESISFTRVTHLPTFMNQKSAQLYTQMMCMNAPYGLAILWDLEGVMFMIVPFKIGFAMELFSN